MNVLIACEETQRACTAFREKGHNAFSCDILECSGGHPEWHIKANVLPFLNGDCEFQTVDGQTHNIDGAWDMIIAHPPCTYLTNGGAVRMFRKEIKEYQPYGVFQMVNTDRLKQGIIARDFFMQFYNADCQRICIENPMPLSIYMLPKETQIIQPYMFGEPFSKKTYLWLKGLQPLKSTNIIQDFHPFINGGGGRMKKTNYKNQKFSNSSIKRSKTFSGIARAMAEQWG